ncbi:MAG: UDP-N-acetylmuramoyl-L-alanine--D-glutamate ligase [Deltaproteobacteria bacterium]|nr:UDP-N-acetylmuramoyl-L-alanine--D-glutamate ligase [Deltaproteobacteria bacterium]
MIMHRTDTPEHVKRLLESLRPPLALAGFGVEGRETLRFLLEMGWPPEALGVYDRRLEAEPPEDVPAGVRVHGPGREEELGGYGTVLRSPGLRPDHPALLAAREAGADISSATRLFLAAHPGLTVGVTGTLGKGTTVTLTGRALEALGRSCRLGGNIGVNPLTFLAGMTARSVAVLELSSFQLMDLEGRRPEVAVVLRTTSEHLDWHRDTAEYRRAKSRLLAPADSGQTVIYLADSPGSREVAGERLATMPAGSGGSLLAVSRVLPVVEGIGLDQAAGGLARFSGGVPQALPGMERLAMPGLFNRENAAAAYLAVEVIDRVLENAPGESTGEKPPRLEKALEALRTFPGMPHRLEFVGRIGGVECYNDSYATRPDAAIGALESFDSPLAVILGGSEKEAEFGSLARTLCQYPALLRIVLIGATAERIARAIRSEAAASGREAPQIFRAKTLEEAVAASLDALGAAGGQGVLLFSPACASFDMFPNYKVRGERFTELVKRAAI